MTKDYAQGSLTEKAEKAAKFHPAYAVQPETLFALLSDITRHMSIAEAQDYLTQLHSHVECQLERLKRLDELAEALFRR